jgi:AAA+ superfamily predicted ATPase
MEDKLPLDKKISEITFGDVIKLGKKFKRQQGLKSELLSDFFEADLSQISNTTENLSAIQHAIRSALFMQYLNKTKYKIVQAINIEGDYQYPFEYQEVETDPEVFVQGPNDGILFLSSPDMKLAVEWANWTPEMSKYRMYYLSEDKAKALKFQADLKEYVQVHNIFRGKKITPELTHIKLERAYTWDDIALPTNIKQEIVKNVNLLLESVVVYEKNNISFKRGLILAGPPGTGKTLTGKILCSNLKDVTFIWVTPGHIEAGARAVKAICEMARELAPTVLFLEDIDLYGAHRERARGEVLGELMNQLDGIVSNEFVVTIATTNRVEEVETAIRNRPGRFDRVLEVPIPDAECRMKMLDMYTKDFLFAGLAGEKKAEFMKTLGEKTDGMTGAHIKELVNSAVLTAVEEKSLDKNYKIILKSKHFINNLELVAAKKITPAGFGAASDAGKRGLRSFHDFLDDEDM